MHPLDETFTNKWKRIMLNQKLSVTAAAMVALLVTSECQPCLAHFPWLATDDAGHALLFFGESPAERDYHLPAAVEEADVAHHVADGKAQSVNLEPIDTQAFIGRRSAAALKASGELYSTIVYGVYHGAKLSYYVQHDLSLAETNASSSEQPSQPFVASIAPFEQQGIEVQVMWQGKPLVDAEVKLYCEAGHEEGATQTDDQGRAWFTAGAVEPGLNGLLVGFTDKQDAGEHDGKKYQSAAHYLTATFRYQATAEGQPKDEHSDAKTTASTKLTPLPEGLASFGAAVADGQLYVYSGHIGTAHEHSRDNLSAHFRRLKIDGGDQWQELPAGPPLQGLPLVSHAGMLYRVGGLDARNAAGEADDMHSTDSFARFDPRTMKWQDLPPLPEPRSSHDAVVMGDKLFVVGGWTLSGSDQGEWLDTAWVCDLTRATDGWKPIAAPPFRRRALAAVHLDGKLIVMGGLDDERNVSQSVDALDLSTGKWTKLAEFPSEGSSGHNAAGFGVSAWNHHGVLYASGMEGALYRLTSENGKWQPAGQLAEARFFHRLLPAGKETLLAIGGASPEEGHLKSVELLPIKP